MPGSVSEDMGKLPIIQYWNTEIIPNYITDLFVTFRDENPDFCHRVFSEEEATRFIASHFGSREVTAFRACSIPSMQSDYFRYCAVLALGGVYADADYRCLRSLRPLIDESTGGEIFLSPTPLTHKGHDATRVWSGFFAFEKSGHPFLRLALEIATANMEARIPERIWPVGKKVVEGIWLTVGPGVPSLMRLLHDLGSFDAFMDTIHKTDAEPFGELYCEVIGDYERLVRAFDGVSVSPHERMAHWVGAPDFSLPYKETDVHWHNANIAIFR